MHALISVYDKTGVIEFARKLAERGYKLISTGGTHRALSEADIQVTELSSLTGFPEILGGRVKSLHPKIFGGILANPSNPDHIKDALVHNLPDIGLVVVNLYPFWNITKEDSDEHAIEEIDIGGVALIRAAAKNFANVAVLTNPNQYADFLDKHEIDFNYRRQLAASAFKVTSDYDSSIANHFNSDTTTIQRTYHPIQPPLKYGCNPHQAPALIYSIDSNKPPLKLLNGSWSYINVLDAINAWGLVSELDIALDLQGSAASFKHTSPAGAASQMKWNDLNIHTKQMLTVVYGLSEKTHVDVLTYARARNSDPQSSFGDFIGFNGIVGDELAEFISHQVSDGIIAAGFSDNAVKVLSSKKKGAFVIIQRLQGNSSNRLEFREIGGVALSQPKNTKIIRKEDILATIPTKLRVFPDEAIRDLIVANVCMKYAQSNNVACAFEGQLIGLAAGQQSRVDAVRLMTRKVKCWLNRHNAEALSGFSAASGSRQQRIIDYTVAAEKTAQSEWLPDISVASDAFFPFSDNIEELSNIPVKFITQAGGSIRDSDVVDACDRLGIAMSMTGIRVFTH